MRLTRPNEVFTDYLQLDKDDISQFPTAIILDSSDSIIATINMIPSTVTGKYLGTFTFTNVGDYSIKYVIYSDSSRTIINPRYKRGDLTVRVSNLEGNVEKIIGGNFGSPVANFN